MFHLVALRPTLTTLLINGNPGISDDAIPALILMDKLWVLGLEDTSVTMVGLRRLTTSVFNRCTLADKAGIDFSLSVPEGCNAYLDGKSRKSLMTVSLNTHRRPISVFRPFDQISH